MSSPAGTYPFPTPSPNPGDTLTGCALRRGMGREQRRAKNREEAKRERDAQRAARKPSSGTFRSMAGERPETQDETARRIYRTGGKPKRRAKTGRRVSAKPLKWREGRQ